MKFTSVILQIPGLILFASGVLAAPLSPQAIANFKSQVAVIEAQKSARSVVQLKVDSNILGYLHENVLKDMPAYLPKLQHHVTLDAANEVMVDIKANVTDSLISLIKDQGGDVINAFPQYQALRARLPITAVETIAGDPDVIFINKAAKAYFNQATVSEGYVAHNVPVLRNLGYDGQGVKVGVLSDSIQSSDANPLDYLKQVQATGDLPAKVNYLPGQAGSGDGEGVAMLEIVYDLAPKASLYFATANPSAAQFATNILALANAGCKVIIDDVSYDDESPFQDDPLSQAVATVTKAGVAYFSSAANSGNLHSNNSGTWEGDFHDSGQTFKGGAAHAFSGTDMGNEILDESGAEGKTEITLFWSDPLGKSTNEYDLYLTDSNGNIIAQSTNPMTGTQDPFQSISTGDGVGDYVVIVKTTGAVPRFLHLNVARSRIDYGTNGETHGHCTVDGAYCVAATTAKGRTKPFTGAEAVENFSSDGPRRIFYNPDGTAITPGNLSSTGGRVRYKPDLTAADGVACSANYPMFNPFYGTSAAAPHAGAIAACLLSARPNLSPTALRRALTQSCLPAPPVWNDYLGYGIVMADRALKLLPSGSPGLGLLLLQ